MIQLENHKEEKKADRYAEKFAQELARDKDVTIRAANSIYLGVKEIILQAILKSKEDIKIHNKITFEVMRSRKSFAWGPQIPDKFFEGDDYEKNPETREIEYQVLKDKFREDFLYKDVESYSKDRDRMSFNDMYVFIKL